MQIKPSTQSASSRNKNFCYSGQKLHRSSYQSCLLFSNFTWCPYFFPNILSMIVITITILRYVSVIVIIQCQVWKTLAHLNNVGGFLDPSLGLTSSFCIMSRLAGWFLLKKVTKYTTLFYLFIFQKGIRKSYENICGVVYSVKAVGLHTTD